MEILEPKHPLNLGAPEYFDLYKLKIFLPASIKAVSFPRVPEAKIVFFGDSFWISTLYTNISVYIMIQ